MLKDCCKLLLTFIGDLWLRRIYNLLWVVRWNDLVELIVTCFYRIIWIFDGTFEGKFIVSTVWTVLPELDFSVLVYPADSMLTHTILALYTRAIRVLDLQAVLAFSIFDQLVVDTIYVFEIVINVINYISVVEEKMTDLLINLFVFTCISNGMIIVHLLFE